MERQDLAEYAAQSDYSRGRRYEEAFKDDRPAYERDRDRIIHCAAFRRLEYKTQVFVNHEGDYYRTRLTHSLEVAQIGRGIARRLKLNEDLVETLALAHDLGHTPFGHTGEDVLDRLMKPYGGFEHNRQSLRIVELLEERLLVDQQVSLKRQVAQRLNPDGTAPFRQPVVVGQVAAFHPESGHWGQGPVLSISAGTALPAAA